jgi:uncharacterized SAM-binding protein YcdF (DUF218 family)
VALMALGIVLAGYGLAVMTVWSGSLFFCTWYVLGGLCVAVGVAMRRGAWQRLPQALRVGAASVAAVAVVAAVFLSANVMRASRESKPDRVPDDLQWVVVLGAQVKADGTPSNVLRYRLDAACDYLKGHPGSMAIVSGGQGLNEPISEASCMATYLRERGIDPGRIQLEDESRTTVENLRFCSRILREQGFDPATVRVGIVTNDFHLYRACRIARRQGLAGAVGIGAYSTPSTCPTTCCANARA